MLDILKVFLVAVLIGCIILMLMELITPDKDNDKMSYRVKKLTWVDLDTWLEANIGSFYAKIYRPYSADGNIILEIYHGGEELDDFDEPKNLEDAKRIAEGRYQLYVDGLVEELKEHLEKN